MKKKTRKQYEKMHPANFQPEGKGKEVIKKYERANAEFSQNTYVPNFDKKKFMKDRTSMVEYFLWRAEHSLLDDRIVEEASECGVSLSDIYDENGYRMIHCAVNGRKPSNVLLMLEHSRVDERTNDGWTPLHCSCHSAYMEIARVLLRRNANVNAQTNSGITALHLAVVSGNFYLVEMLLLWPEININLTSKAGETAFDVANRTSAVCDLFAIKNPQYDFFC